MLVMMPPLCMRDSRTSAEVSVETLGVMVLPVRRSVPQVGVAGISPGVDSASGRS
nr:hypothetical protein [Halomonas elongata]